MFITKKHLSRRTFLRGAGVTLTLPFLEAMVPAQTPLARTAANPRAKFGFIYVPMGSIMKQWTPEQAGAGFEFSPILKPLEPFRENVVVVSGLHNSGEPGHSVSSATFLSGAIPHKGNVLKLNTTVDQVIAQKIGQDTTFPSLEFATEDHSSRLGSCAGDFLCSYMSTVSWRTPTQPLPMELNPRVVFERMFGGDAATAEQRSLQLSQSTSILDAVRGSLKDLSKGLGPQDVAKLNEYLENVREIERQIIQGEKQRAEYQVETPETPSGIPEDWVKHVKLMFDLQALAFQGNMTRVQSFMLSRELSTLSYPFLGVNDGHHPISHNNNVPEQVTKKAKVDTFHLSLFADYLRKLKSMQDGEGTVFDNVVYAYGSGMSNGNQHIHTNLPMVLVGGAAGRLKGDRHIKVKEGSTPASNLWLSMINMAGGEMAKYGESNGRLEL
jgi:hypothetical protein